MAQVESVHSQDEAHGSFKSYTLGFLCSIVLTLIPIVIVMNHWLEGTEDAVMLMMAGVLQLVVQLFFFMHLREEKKPRYNLISLLLGLVILLVIVAGSMWIMMYNMVAL
ncbi:cytochrome o ubiquinol oxidase subunit IV [Paenibacillus baekrokdamisoli]|uniref:Cytochrome o ubiquinol oxidase subunit IV n=1 Tax=Paenibacillus baekrokdamisoli TaxID=1712516 RepID=A0A3G9IW27_9BACL|nr:cytochrome o ubiquinol oxidase subunit IV [Paenibacillus baekrokdamisoli]MBB3072054.1 cytochrome o ubiquinol oxidase operon protein cyoD [Paenibacillus baekrokdamisoli]BBH20355.1 cytochrome o ubiquinol oxidase subunit IV [Paenibacillus baekrokdamisoli]